MLLSDLVSCSAKISRERDLVRYHNLIESSCVSKGFCIVIKLVVAVIHIKGAP